jgi:hypothetical protein
MGLSAHAPRSKKERVVRPFAIPNKFCRRFVVRA